MRYILILLFINLIIQNVYCFGYEIHRYLGRITDEYLKKNEIEIKNKINISIEKVSDWADKIKRNKKYEWTKEIHYIDVYNCMNKQYDKEIIDKYCKDNCIISGIKTLTRLLKRNKYYNMERAYDEYVEERYKELTDEEKMKLLIHLIQDFSQPMHYIGFKRGGNDYKIRILYDGRNITTNLHSIWDTMIPKHFITQTKYKGMNLKYEKEDDTNILINRIFNRNIKIACKIYPENSYIKFEEYYNEDYVKELFDNYLEVMIKILKMIYE